MADGHYPELKPPGKVYGAEDRGTQTTFPAEFGAVCLFPATVVQ